MSKQNIYLISGLGADESIFQNLSFNSNCIVNFIKWIEPNKNESFNDYCIRISEQINTDESIVLIGLSFGGAIAQELSSIVNSKKTIIISSFKSSLELPFYYRLIGRLKIHKVVPFSFLKKSSFITNWFFGVQTKTEEAILKSFLENVSLNFLKWSINIIVTNKFDFKKENLVHIHGTSDRILPFRYIGKNLTVRKGGHFMIFNKSNEINALLETII